MNPALWHFWHFIHFIESISYRNREVWKSSTPAASTSSKHFYHLISGWLRENTPRLKSPST